MRDHGGGTVRFRFAAGLACAALLALDTPNAAAAADPGSGVVAQAVRAADLGPGTAPGAVPPGAAPTPRPATPAPTPAATPAPTPAPTPVRPRGTPAPPYATTPTLPRAGTPASPHPAAPAPSHAPTPAPARTATPAPTRDAALAAAVARWVAVGGEEDLATLGEDFTVLEQAASAGQLPVMGAGCRQLGIDVRAAQGHAPIPDARAERYWAAALARYARGAADCVAGTGTNDTGLMVKASNEIIEGSDDLDQVTNRLNEIG